MYKNCYSQLTKGGFTEGFSGQEKVNSCFAEDSIRHAAVPCLMS